MYGHGNMWEFTNHETQDLKDILNACETLDNYNLIDKDLLLEVYAELEKRNELDNR